MSPNYPQKIAQLLEIPASQINNTITLFADGNTVPFIARYRKEMTGGLDEEQIRQIQSHLANLRALDDRRQTVLTTIESQGALTPELRRKIGAVTSRTELEDLYQPYKPKRQTRASQARDKGLAGLAQYLLAQPITAKTLEELATPFLNVAVTSVEEALAGARDIVAEAISDDPDVRQQTRTKALEWGRTQSGLRSKADDARGTYRDYYDLDLRVNRLRPHQILALNRGEAEKILRVNIEVSERDWRSVVDRVFRPDHRSPLGAQMRLAIDEAAQRLLLPAIERDIRRALTQQAEDHAIHLFAKNLRALLNQPPLVGHTIIGLDPGYRTGCKVAVVDETGKVLDVATIYPHPPQSRRAESLNTLADLARRYRATLVAIGNGTASRETEKLVADLAQTTPIQYLIVSEAGASVYSASPLARAELPDLDVSLRGAVSIARRVQDPLAELVKIDPQSIGVGLYQHDVNQKRLSETLDQVVESVVNAVGVDVNTASPALLTYVAGIGAKLAERIVAHREQYGAFRNRTALLKVSGLGAKTFEQCAGFLRIRNGDNPLDASAIHPESYPAAERVLQLANTDMHAPIAARQKALDDLQARRSLARLAKTVGIGELTLADILAQLVAPGRDPRADLPAPLLRKDVITLDDLSTGMQVKGTVRNVVDFGAFIDIGVKYDGLLHRSQIPRGTVLNVGQVLSVRILSLDLERGRIGLGWVQ